MRDVTTPKLKRPDSTIKLDRDQLLKEGLPALRDRCTLTILTGSLPGAVFAIEAEQTLIGRDAQCTIALEDVALSRVQAEIIHRSGSFFLKDRESTNGTFLNGTKAVGEKQLQDGDRIKMGQTVLKVSLQDAVEQDASRKLYESAVRDPLTQVYNRRFFDERLVNEFAYALRHSTPISLLVLDIDHFKKVNDSYGHPTGDAVLRVVGSALQETLRREDIVARFGGEEFAIIARGIAHPNACILAERIRRKVEALIIQREGGTLSVTMSIGVATLGPGAAFQTSDAMLSAADEALYRAKAEGRNRVCTA